VKILRFVAPAGAIVLGLTLVACGSDATPAPTVTVTAPAPVPSTPTPTPTPTSTHATAPSPGTPPSEQGYLDCLSDPSTTLAYCQQFNPSPSPSSTPPRPTPTPVATIPTAPYVVGDCVLVSNDPNDSTSHNLTGHLCQATSNSIYKVINVTTGINANFCKTVDPTFATDDVLQFRDNQNNRTYCLNPIPGSAPHPA
jgi:hypothetical protein